MPATTSRPSPPDRESPRAPSPASSVSAAPGLLAAQAPASAGAAVAYLSRHKGQHRQLAPPSSGPQLPATPVAGPLPSVVTVARSLPGPRFQDQAPPAGISGSGMPPAPPTRAEPTRNPAPCPGRSADGCSTRTRGRNPRSPRCGSTVTGRREAHPTQPPHARHSMIERAICGH